jgi:hypothetical protein
MEPPLPLPKNGYAKYYDPFELIIPKFCKLTDSRKITPPPYPCGLTLSANSPYVTPPPPLPGSTG